MTPTSDCCDAPHKGDLLESPVRGIAFGECGQCGRVAIYETPVPDETPTHRSGAGLLIGLAMFFAIVAGLLVAHYPAVAALLGVTILALLTLAYRQSI